MNPAVTPFWNLAHAGMELVVSARGGVVLNWRVPGPTGMRELLDGYQGEAELQELHGCRNGIMAPWSNRIAGARYEFAGAPYDLGPAEDGSREAIHGLVMTAEFTELSRTENELVLVTEVAPIPAYPWRVRVEVGYRISHAVEGYRLDFRLAQRNLSTEAAPIAGGWHPYVNHLGIGDWAVEIPAMHRIVLGEDLIPLPGEAGYAAEKVAPRLVNPQVLDGAWTGLLPEDDGVARGRLLHGDGSTTTLEYCSPIGQPGNAIMHFFTGDTLRTRTCQSFAMEPCLNLTNAFNRAECAAGIRVAPGQERVLEAALVHSIG